MAPINVKKRPNLTEKIAIIPARSGSVGIPNKNLQKIGGNSLLQIKIKQAVKINKFDRILLTTDYDMETLYKHIEPEWLSQVCIFHRSAETASGTACAADVVGEVIDFLNLRNTDVVVYLQPTSPFCSLTIVQEVLDHVVETGQACFVLKKDPIVFEKCAEMVSQASMKCSEMAFLNRQSFKPVYQFAGSVYGFTCGDFQHKNCFPLTFHPKFSPYIEDLDIDTVEDLQFAQGLRGFVNNE